MGLRFTIVVVSLLLSFHYSPGYITAFARFSGGSCRPYPPLRSAPLFRYGACLLRSSVSWRVRPMSARSMTRLRFASTHLRFIIPLHYNKEPPALISRGNANSASLRWRFPCRGGGERYGLAQLRSLAVTMIGRAHQSKPPQTPSTTPVGGFHPPVSPPPYVLSENWKAHLSTPI